ncbi:hypothetical protein EGM70_00895 [Enterobacteriaceae bacterium 89]|jgi:hypothetical protein|nr:hypothetical protein [Enterobacteriaceae bacterium 89]
MLVHNPATPPFFELELEVLITVVIIGGWGGFVSCLMRKRESLPMRSFIYECLAQIIVSCFTGFILSVIAIERGMSSNLVMVAAGIGGVFASPLLRLLGERVKKIIIGEGSV